MTTATERILEVTQNSSGEKPKVALDTNCVRYYINNPPVQPWADCLDPVFQAALDERIELFVSTVVVSELLAHVHFANRHVRGYDPELDLLAIINRHFKILDVDGEVARAAGRIRGNYIPGDKIVLKTPDALIGATSMTNGHTLFITNDALLADALPGNNCIYLRDVALDWLTLSFPNPCFYGIDPVVPSKRGKGIPTGASTTSLDIGCCQPDPSAKWQRVLKDSQIVASLVNTPCAFFVLTEMIEHREETREVLFWHESLATSRPPKTVIKRLKEHLGISRRTGLAANERMQINAFIFASLAIEKARQSQPTFASKDKHQKEADAWNRYLSLWRTYRSCLDLPQTTWLLCEDGANRILDIGATVSFLDRAKNVFGWNDEI